MDSVTFSIPIASIGVYYAHAVNISSKGDPLKNHDNRNPNGSQYHETLKKRLSAKEFASWERSKRAHVNTLENMPLFVATVFAGLLAEQKAGAGAVGLDTFCLATLVVRTLYIANYITGETKGWSLVRSLLYAIGVGWSFKTLWSSAVAIGN